MDVRTILQMNGGNVVTVTPESTITEAAGQLIAHDIGVVVVTDADGQLSGILSERDISRAVADSAARIAEIKVGDLMETRVITCAIDDSIIDAVTLMNNDRIRHLPVLDGERVVGIVSMRDVSNVWQTAMGEELERLQRSIDTD